MSEATAAAAAALAPRKSLGQHFLLDEAICRRIAAQAGDLTGRQVLEVGPGPGGLTRALLGTPAASVTAVEFDSRAVAVLEPLVAEAAGRLRVVEGDALSLDLTTLVPEPRQIIANLPYNIASPLLVGWMRQAAAFERLTLMFQQEVAERIAAAPNTEAYGRLSVLCQWRCEVRLAMSLPPGAFRPPPKVWSAVVVLEPHPEAPAPALFRAMERTTAAAFGQRRKMLRGALKSLGDAEGLLVAAGIDGSRRAETLTVAEFATLAGLVNDRTRSPAPQA